MSPKSCRFSNFQDVAFSGPIGKSSPDHDPRSLLRSFSRLESSTLASDFSQAATWHRWETGIPGIFARAASLGYTSFLGSLPDADINLRDHHWLMWFSKFGASNSQWLNNSMSVPFPSHYVQLQNPIPSLVVTSEVLLYMLLSYNFFSHISSTAINNPVTQVPSFSHWLVTCGGFLK